jgi:hypothetical protein
LVAVVESWVPHANVRRDLFGFADIIGVHVRDHLFLLVQVTTASHLAHRLKKAQGRPELREWLRAGGHFEAHGWERRDRRWRVRRVAIKAEDLQPVRLTPTRRRRQPKQRGLFDALITRNDQG